MTNSNPPGPAVDPTAPNSLYTITPPDKPAFTVHWLILRLLVGVQISINCLMLGRYGVCELQAVDGTWRIMRVMNTKEQ